MVRRPCCFNEKNLEVKIGLKTCLFMKTGYKFIELVVEVIVVVFVVKIVVVILVLLILVLVLILALIVLLILVVILIIILVTHNNPPFSAQPVLPNIRLCGRRIVYK